MGIEVAAARMIAAAVVRMRMSAFPEGSGGEPSALNVTVAVPAVTPNAGCQRRIRAFGTGHPDRMTGCSL
ncbi:hypothetical protein GCM10010464_02640 [Pseudonocardia yunnanensis]